MTEANRKWWVLAATGGSLGIVLLDETVVGVALPTLRDELGMSQLASHWIVNAYLLALAALVAAGGRIGDLIGLRTVFCGGAAIFAIGSLASGLAQSGEWIIVSRVVQGVGAAGMWSTGIGMTASVFGPSERGKAFAYYGFGGTIALCLGPFVGGLLTELASWRWIFFINLPIAAGVIAVMVAAWREPERTAPRPAFDYRGLALSALVLVPLVLGLMQGPDWGWDSTSVLALFAIAILALPAFVWLELRAAAPLIDVRLLRQKTVVASNVALAAAQFSKMSVIIFGALFLQDRLGMSPLEAGAALLAATAAVAIGLVPSGRLTDQHGARLPTLLGVSGMVIGLVWLAIFVPEKSYPLLLPGFVLWGASLPFFFTPPRSATMNVVPEEKHGEAGGVLTTSQMLGGTLGISILGAILVDAGSYAAIFAVTAGVTAFAWIVCFLLMQRPEAHHKRVPPVAWAHSLVGLPAHIADAIRHGTPSPAQVGERSDD